MIRALLPALLLAGPVAAAGLDLNEDQRAAFRQEVRAALLADPGPVARALDIEAPDLYAEEAQQDLDRIDDRTHTIWSKVMTGFLVTTFSSWGWFWPP